MQRPSRFLFSSISSVRTCLRDVTRPIETAPAVGIRALRCRPKESAQVRACLHGTCSDKSEWFEYEVCSAEALPVTVPADRRKHRAT